MPDTDGTGRMVIGRVSGDADGRQTLCPLATLGEVEKYLQRAVGSADIKRVRDSARKALELLRSLRTDIGEASEHGN